MSELIKREDVQREIQASFDGGAFRWQDGQDLMDRINAIPAASPWHRVEEPPKENGAYVVWWNYKGSSYWFRGVFFDGRWLFERGTPKPDYWMPIEPPKEEA